MVWIADIGYHRYCRDGKAQVVCHDDLGHGTHAYSICANDLQVTILGPGFQLWPYHRSVDALMKGNAFFFGYGFQMFAHFQVVGPAHIGKSTSQVLDTPEGEGRASLQIYVVCDQEQL